MPQLLLGNKTFNYLRIPLDWGSIICKACSERTCIVAPIFEEWSDHIDYYCPWCGPEHTHCTFCLGCFKPGPECQKGCCRECARIHGDRAFNEPRKIYTEKEFYDGTRWKGEPVRVYSENPKLWIEDF